MSSVDRQARRRAQRTGGVQRRGRGLPGHHLASVWEAIPAPEAGAPDHVIVRLGVGDPDCRPAAYLELCSHNAEDFIRDLRRAIESARETGRPVVIPGGPASET